MKHYSDKTSLTSIYLSTDKESTKGVLMVSRDTYVTLIQALFGHLFLDDKMVLSGMSDMALPADESFPYSIKNSKHKGDR